MSHSCDDLLSEPMLILQSRVRTNLGNRCKIIPLTWYSPSLSNTRIAGECPDRVA